MTAPVMEDPVVVKKRVVAPGEIELLSAAALQFIAASALAFAPPRLLAGSGTALLTQTGNPGWSHALTIGWAVIFAWAGCLAVRAVRNPSIKNRRVAWQVIIPLWAGWWTGLAFPLVTGQPTNLIVLAAVFFFINQWIITRMFVPLNGHWYDREYVVPAAEDSEL